MFKNALVSVADKRGLIEFLTPLNEQGMRIVSTGGTARYLRNSGLSVEDVSRQTGFPEVLDGRVKTLHPLIHMALLARPQDHQTLQEYGLEPFDLVIGNLYAYEQAISRTEDEGEKAEFIDIGGPSLLRAAAKNYENITVICAPEDYQWVQRPSYEQRKMLAGKVFSHVAAYDALIAETLGSSLEMPDFCRGGHFVKKLRYGENPGQKASWYRRKGQDQGLHSADILQGKELSFNNILDSEAAVACLREFSEPACVAVKHNNPCGVATGSNVVTKCLAADPVSVFGGIVAVNFPLDEGSARSLMEVFLEAVVAPQVSPEARKILAQKKNLRVIEWPQLLDRDESWEVHNITGGFLLQTPDTVEEWSENWSVIGATPETGTQNDLMVAWKVAAHLKSNAIALVSQGQTLGLGMGQVNRVDAVDQALQREKHFHPDKGPVVLASDGFFPFADGVEKAAAAGVHWIIQPGGSKRDQQIQKTARKLGVNMVLTGTRHFRH